MNSPSISQNNTAQFVEQNSHIINSGLSASNSINSTQFIGRQSPKVAQLSQPQFKENSFTGVVRELFNSYISATQLGRQQRSIDKAQGYSLTQGVKRFNDRMYKAQHARGLYQALNSSLVAMQQGQSPIDAFGASAQQYQIEQLKNEAIAFGIKQLGLEAAGNSTAALATNSGGAKTATTAAGTLADDGLASMGSNILGAAGALYSGYQMIDSWGQSNATSGAIQGAAIGSYVGSIIPGVGTLIGGLAGGAIGAVAGSIKSGKHKDQKGRDVARDFLQSRGMLNNKHELKLADGSMFNVGVDGGHRFDNLDGGSRAAYQTDTSNPLTEKAVAWLDPLAEVLMGGNEKLRADFAGYFSNAATSNATNYNDLLANTVGLYSQANLSPEAVAQGVSTLVANGKIDEQRAAAYINSLQELNSVLGLVQG